MNLRSFTVPAALAALVGLAGCVGAPAPGPVGYGVPPGPPSGYASGYPAPAPTAVAYSAHCSAGFYNCALPQALPIGAACSCPGLGAPSYGNVN